jgi:hypothetical protein
VRLTIAIEFSAKRENAILCSRRPVLDIIENPGVAQALRQDNSQNLRYLKDNYNVRSVLGYHYLVLTPNL